jgi:phosphoglycerol transferase MdoB-like AlkP superfamily enzyme
MNPRFRPLVALGAASLLVGAVLRATLWWQFGVADGVAPTELPSVLFRGLLNDLVVTLYAFTPFALYLALIPARWMRSRAHRILVSAGSWVTLFALVFLAVVELYFFQEFDSRFNLVAFDYLAYPTEVVGDVWAEYPVVRTAMAAALIASAGVVVIRRWFPGRDGQGTGR